MDSLVQDPGKNIAAYEGKSLSQCAQICEDIVNCKSFAYCPTAQEGTRDGKAGIKCVLQDKQLNGIERMVSPTGTSAPDDSGNTDSMSIWPNCYSNYRTCQEGIDEYILFSTKCIGKTLISVSVC